MSLPERGLSARSLAELALIVSRVTRSNFHEPGIPSVASLRTFWQSGRLLEQRWTRVLDDWSVDKRSDVETLAGLAPRVFTSEMLSRVWSTILAGIDRRRGSDDLLRVGRNAVNSLGRIRNGILARFLTVAETSTTQVLEIDRLRRRCDRWNDALIGSMAAHCGCFEFAFDADRARDFSEESLSIDPAVGPNPADHFLSAGLRLNFIRHLPIEPLDEPEIASLAKSILSNIPRSALHRDGTFRTLLEQRIADGCRRLERRAGAALFLYDSDSIPPRTKAPRKSHRDE